MPVVESGVAEEKSSVHKGLVFLMGLGAFVFLWLVGYGSNMLVYSSQLILPVFLPIVVSIPIALLFNRIARVYPGSATVFGYAATSLLSVALGSILLVTLSNGQSWLEIGVISAVISLVYPVVAVGFSHGLEVFVDKLGLKDGGVSHIEHYDTIHARKSSDQKDYKPVIMLVDVPDAPLPPRDFSDAVKTVTDEEGVAILEIDFAKLEAAERPTAHQRGKDVKPKPKPAPRAPRKTESAAKSAVAESKVKKPAPKRKPAARKTQPE